MKITSIRVKKVDNGNIKGIASITIDNAFAVNNIKIVQSKDNGLFISMPSRKNTDGKYIDIAHPINSETRKLVTDLIVEEYNKINETESTVTSKEDWLIKSI